MHNTDRSCALASPRLLILISLIALAANPVFAQQPASTAPPSVTAPPPPAPDAAIPPISAERPGFTNGTDTVPMGHLQLETGYLYSTQDGVSTSHLNDAGQLRLPFSADAEFRIVTPAYYFGASGNGSASGFTDTGVSFKWRFLEETPGRRPSLALIAGTTFPSGSPELRANHLQPGLDLEGQFTLSPLFQMQANGTYTRADDNGTLFNQYSGAFNINYNVTPNINPFLELYRLTPTGIGDPGASYFDGGVTFAVGTNIQLDVNAGIGIGSGANSDHFLGAGFAERW